MEKNQKYLEDLMKGEFDINQYLETQKQRMGVEEYSKLEEQWKFIQNINNKNEIMKLLGFDQEDITNNTNKLLGME